MFKLLLHFEDESRPGQGRLVGLSTLEEGSSIGLEATIIYDLSPENINACDLLCS